MTGTEDALRAALRDLAPTAPADGAAHAGVQRAVRRRRRRRAAARVAAAVLVLVAVGGAVTVRSLAEPEGSQGYVTEGSRSPGADDTVDDGAPGPAGPTASGAAGTVEIGPATFPVPESWSADRTGEGTVCLAPPDDGTALRWNDCAGLLVQHGDLVGHEGAPYTEHGPWGFSPSTDPVPCPFPATGPAPGDTVVQGEVGTGPIDQRFAAVGDHTATYDQWFAKCSVSAYTFTPRAWFLPRSELLIIDVFGLPEAEEILEAVTFDE